MTFDDPQELSAIAGEYVMGTLDDGDRIAVARAMTTNTALAAEVARWQDRLLGLTRRVAPVEPASGLWARIDAALPGTSSVASPGATARAPSPSPSPSPSAASIPAPSESTSRASIEPARSVQPGTGVSGDLGRGAANDSFWNRVGVWKTLSGLAVAACLVMVMLLAVQRQDTGAARYVAVLQSPDKLPGWIVETSSNAPLRLIPLTADTSVPEGKSLQFWTKLDGAAGPTSLGIVRNGQRIEVELGKLPGVAGNQLFEITLEPPNGSPLNKPTGPILFIGRSVKV